jgi:hypothetical protein
MRSRWMIEMQLARQRAARRRTSSAGCQNLFPPLVLIGFIALKLSGVIGWSWWWVLSPLWISGILLVLGLCASVVLLRRQARMRMRAWVNYFQSADWWQDGPRD